MCRPEHFEVAYAINPWMDPTRPVDRDRGGRPVGGAARDVRALGPHGRADRRRCRACPTWCFAANGGLVVGGRGARGPLHAPAAHRPRRRRTSARLRQLGLEAVVEPTHVNEGEGDFVVGRGPGARRHRLPHRPGRSRGGGARARCGGADARAGRSALLPPRHVPGSARRQQHRLLPEAFSAAGATCSRRSTRRRARLARGRRGAGPELRVRRPHVVLSRDAVGLAGQLRDAGYEPVPVDLSELLKAGGSVKCCTLELRG
jgi:hypothetical protein